MLIKKTDFKGMLELVRASKSRFLRGIVFYGGDEICPVSVDGHIFYCIPLGTLGCRIGHETGHYYS